ncbi:MAG: PAS domain-containing sensor histidine kinase [Gemmatimonadota bacterium]|nr:PAS domain-containing sensor histidine kinase [Gemmatimonadota bacterium]
MELASGIGGANLPGAAEDAARENVELHRLLVESVKDYAIFALDPDGYILSWNAGAERFKGYTADEAIGQHFSVFYPREKIEEGFPQLELETAKRTGSFEDEGWRVRKDGTQFWANVVITALRTPSGRLIGFAKVTRDLSERRRAEQELRASEERFRLLVQGVSDYAIFMLTPDGLVAGWNAGAERIKGYVASEIVGQHFSVFYPAQEVAAGKPARELEIARAEGKYVEEGWRVKKNGELFWAGVVLTAIWTDAGDLVGYAKITRDLTERRKGEERALDDARRVAAEEAARRAAEEREAEVRDLAALLGQQTSQLEEANRVKAQFLAVMSHELRTPLNAIGGYASLMSMGISGPVTDQQVEQLERISRSQQHLLGIINDILNFSRMEAGQVTYEIGVVSVHEAVESVAKMIAPQAEARGLIFTPADCPLELAVLADPRKLDQILINLLSNAVKFTEAGGTITVEWHATAESVELTVRDTGAGIPADQLGQIFEPFVQVGRSLTSHREGTGLGLSISRDLARAMDGDISVESASGTGSAFTIRLPRAHS